MSKVLLRLYPVIFYCFSSHCLFLSSFVIFLDFCSNCFVYWLQKIISKCFLLSLLYFSFSFIFFCTISSAILLFGWHLVVYEFKIFCYFLQLLSGATFLGAIFCFSSFCFKSLYGFIALFSVGEILVFATQVSKLHELGWKFECFTLNYCSDGCPCLTVYPLIYGKEQSIDCLNYKRLWLAYHDSQCFCRLPLIMCVFIVLNQVWGHYPWLSQLFQFTYLVMFLPPLWSGSFRYAFNSFIAIPFVFKKYGCLTS